jgi:chemotaxis protein MotB
VLNPEGNPIIIKKKKGHGHAAHGGAWKVAYADFVTAMMALFIVLWILGQDQAIKETVAHYFRDPIGFSDKGKNILQGNSSQVINIELQKALQQRETEKQELKKMGDKILNELSQDPEYINIVNQIKIEIVDEGLRIEIVDSTNDVFFEIGNAKLKPAMVNLLRKIGDQLSRLPNKIIIEGHTDSRPYHGNNEGYTNFELSADRANAARSALANSKLNPDQIEEIRGYADRRLRDKKDPYNLVNRRISIIVKYLNYKSE